MTVLVQLIEALRNAAVFNKHELAPPRVVLWPDEDSLWASCIEPIRERFPALWTLGDYAPEHATGPAAWLRYQLDTHGADQVPVIYLPGVDRAAFRSAEQCPKPLTHLWALQFQGQFWTQKSGKSWTPSAFLMNKEGGLGLDVAGDQETRKAIQEVLRALLPTELTELVGRKLEAADFRAVVTKAPVQMLLKWMGDPGKLKAELGPIGTEWTTFCAVCRSMYAFDPEKDGAITAAERLAESKGAWPLVWQRYKEAPHSYPGVRELLRTLPPAQLFDQAVEFRPLWNEKAERRLEAELLGLASMPQKEAAAQLLVLEKDHGFRGEWVWAMLGDSPLAEAVGPLRTLAELVLTPANPASWEALADYYQSTGWKADYAVLQALAKARSPASSQAAAAAIRAVYLPWLEKFALLTQALTATYPTEGPTTCRTLAVEPGTITLFADGLRLDVARALEARLAETSPQVETTFRCEWSALPTVTATAKSAWLPLASKLGGPLTGAGFQAKERQNGKDLVHARFKQLLGEIGLTFVETNEAGLPNGSAWTEFGSLDRYGHEQGAALAWRVEEELAGLQGRITDLLRAGWRKVQVITDHGWLLVPGGLPPITLPKHLTASRWSRCAAPDPGAQHGFPVTTWFWDPTDAVVLAPGISSFLAGREYAHGGLTMQEALIPSLTVTAKKAGGAGSIVVRERKWSGLRLNVVLVGAAGLTVDLRGKVGDPGTSVAAAPVVASEDGKKTSLLVEDPDLEGTNVFFVVLDASGACIFKDSIIIGGK